MSSHDICHVHDNAFFGKANIKFLNAHLARALFHGALDLFFAEYLLLSRVSFIAGLLPKESISSNVAPERVKQFTNNCSLTGFLSGVYCLSFVLLPICSKIW